MWIKTSFPSRTKFPAAGAKKSSRVWTEAQESLVKLKSSSTCDTAWLLVTGDWSSLDIRLWPGGHITVVTNITHDDSSAAAPGHPGPGIPSAWWWEDWHGDTGHMPGTECQVRHIVLCQVRHIVFCQVCHNVLCQVRRIVLCQISSALYCVNISSDAGKWQPARAVYRDHQMRGLR